MGECRESLVTGMASVYRQSWPTTCVAPSGATQSIAMDSQPVELVVAPVPPEMKISQRDDVVERGNRSVTPC